MDDAERDPTTRFADRAQDYARFRPDYPAAAVDAVLGAPGPGPLDAADVASGTGIFARLLAARGTRVVAVEPNESMRAAAPADQRIRWVAGTAEATGLPAASVDLVTVAQAFHWFDVDAALREFARVLRPRGHLAILWNRRSRDDAFTLGYRRALEEIDAEAPAERSTFDPGVVESGRRFGGLETFSAPNAQGVTLHALIGRARSTSTVPKSGPRWERLVQRLTALHAQHRGADGLATFVYRTEVFRWTRCDPARSG